MSELTPKQCKILNKALAILGPKGERWVIGEMRITEKLRDDDDWEGDVLILKPDEYEYCILGSLVAAEAKINKKSEEMAFGTYSEERLSPDVTTIANQIIEDNLKGISAKMGAIAGLDYYSPSIDQKASRVANVLPALNDNEDGFKAIKKAATKTLKKHCPIQKN